ncbi:hypothetical protein N658DRAFT_500867 [Parathielavia hyrcaniae]|uniref:Uncharacterized protein n=1 Tax=Parathielavia hyrcaniae TaxID=113614 RepID=A0AAN6PSU0_9PEZI|nr:hypothetical protein N658DRAFT_500867 [Parathielavia hyrcaniae]
MPVGLETVNYIQLPHAPRNPFFGGDPGEPLTALTSSPVILPSCSLRSAVCPRSW